MHFDDDKVTRYVIFPPELHDAMRNIRADSKSKHRPQFKNESDMKYDVTVL